MEVCAKVSPLSMPVLLFCSWRGVRSVWCVVMATMLGTSSQPALLHVDANLYSILQLKGAGVSCSSHAPGLGGGQ